MKTTLIEDDTSKSCLKFTSCSLKSGKKYILILVATKALVVWFIYTKSHELWPTAHITSPNKPVNTNATLYNVSLFHIPLTSQSDMLPFYLEVSSDVWCFLNGINIKNSKDHKNCKCLPHWHGLDCGIPEAVWKSNYIQQGEAKDVKIQRRKIPRRIIYSVLFSNEFSLLDILIRDGFKAVDIFLVSEEFSNSMSSLLQALKNGYLLEFQSKVMPLQLRNLSNNFRDVKEWSSFMLNGLWGEAWKRISDFRPDDLFIFLHVSSIISKDVLNFLKLYDGFPEPFYFKLRPLLYQFQRGIDANVTALKKFETFPPLGCSFQYFQSVCQGNIMKLYSNACKLDKNEKLNFEKNFWLLEKWIVGTINAPSGWQCNWCISVHEINNVIKNYKWLLNFLYVNGSIDYKKLFDNSVKEGKWLDGSYIDMKFISRYDTYFAPDVVMSDPHRHSFLISNVTS